MTALLPGSNCGQRFESSSLSSSMSGVGVPPSEGIRAMGLPAIRDTTILPSSPHVPPRPLGASHKFSGMPPSKDSFFNLPPAKNATDCPSGEKNGPKAPSVPGSSVTLI